MNTIHWIDIKVYSSLRADYIMTYIQGVPKKVPSIEIYPIVVKAQDFMRLVIKNSIQLCLRTLVFSIQVSQKNPKALKLTHYLNLNAL